MQDSVERTHELERRQQAAEGLRGILTVLNSNRALEEILDYIVGEAQRLLGADATAIYRLLPENKLTIQSTRGLNKTYIEQMIIPLGQLATGKAALLLEPVTLPDFKVVLAESGPDLSLAQSQLLQDLADQFNSVLSVPLIIKEEPVGTLTLYYRQRHNFTREEIDLAVAFCDQSALAIENARLREQAKLDAINAERSRIARDLHDSVTQMLFSASLIAEVFPVVWKRDQAEGELALEELRQLTRGALAEMRSMLLELRPAGLQGARLEDLLRQLSESIIGRMRVPVSVSIHEPINLPEDVRLAFYRIAQEALNNITKHSGATRIEVSLAPLPERGVEMRIQDNGYGFTPQLVPADHLGLNIMRERAASAGAEIAIISHPGAGTQVAVQWKPQEKQAGEA